MPNIKLLVILKQLIILILIKCTTPVSAATITWHSNLSNLPPPNGKAIQHGLAGAYSGILHINESSGTQSEVLVVAGGANFSKVPLLDAIKNDIPPEKIYHSDIFVLSKAPHKQAQWQRLNLKLPSGSAYGESIATEKGILLFGGELKQNDGSVIQSSNISLIYSDHGEISYKKIGDMPITFSKGAAAYYEGKIYIIGGIQNGKASNNVYSYEIASEVWRKKQPLPGNNRVSPVAAVHTNDKTQTAQLFVFSGYNVEKNQNTALNDGLTLNLLKKNANWQTLAPIEFLQDKQLSLIGAASINVNEHQTLFLGGYNKSTWDSWLKIYNRVKNTPNEKTAKLTFFSQKPSDYNWNKYALLFDSSTSTWQNLGQTPFLPNCGAAIEYWQNSIVLINGEIKPGVRTAEVKRAIFNGKNIHK